MTGYGSDADGPLPLVRAREGESVVSRNELALMETLASEEFAGLRTLGQGAGVSVSTARRLLRGLVDKGLATYVVPAVTDGTPGTADVTPAGLEVLIEHDRGAEQVDGGDRERARRRRAQRLVRELEQGLAELRSLLDGTW